MLAAVTFVIGVLVSVWLGLKGEDANNGSAIFLDIGLEFAPFGLIAAAAVWRGTTRINSASLHWPLPWWRSWDCTWPRTHRSHSPRLSS
jgi:hypothetical protein